MHNVVIRRFLGRSRLAESLVEDVIAEPKNAMFARDVEELVAECLELEKMSRSAWDYVLGLLFSERANETDELGNMMKMAIAKVSVVFNRVNQLIDEMKARGHGPKEVADFLIARREIQRINEDVARKFPPIDEEMVKRSLEAFRREGRTAEEMLHESQGLRFLLTLARNGAGSVCRASCRLLFGPTSTPTLPQTTRNYA